MTADTNAEIKRSRVFFDVSIDEKPSKYKDFSAYGNKKENNHCLYDYYLHAYIHPIQDNVPFLYPLKTL